MHSFRAKIKIIGINPYVDIPQDILEAIFSKVGRNKGPIPIRGRVNGNDYTQTLVRYAGDWRLYINNKIVKGSPKRIGEILDITIGIDPSDRRLPLHPKLQKALESNPSARNVYESLAPSRQHEINRYICSLKSESKVDENVSRAINFLNNQGRFVGRSRPE